MSRNLKMVRVTHDELSAWIAFPAASPDRLDLPTGSRTVRFVEDFHTHSALVLVHHESFPAVPLDEKIPFWEIPPLKAHSPD